MIATTDRRASTGNSIIRSGVAASGSNLNLNSIHLWTGTWESGDGGRTHFYHSAIKELRDGEKDFRLNF